MRTCFMASSVEGDVPSYRAAGASRHPARNEGAEVMIEASCECGAVRLEIETPPETVGDCNCSICRRYGALWAYYPLAQVRVSGATTV